VNKNLEQMMSEIGENKLVFFDFWSPLEHPERLELSTREFNFGDVSLAYVHESYTRRVLRENVLKQPKSSKRYIKATERYELFRAAVDLALENAFTRGHGMFFSLSKQESKERRRKGIFPSYCFVDTYLPISLKIFSGENGSIVRIRDSGEGFLYQDKIAKMEKGERYFSPFTHGKGMYTMNEPGIQVAYEGAGNIINIMLLGSKHWYYF